MASRPGQTTLFLFLKEGNQRVRNDDEILLPEEGVSQNSQNNDDMSDQSQKKQKVSFNDKWRSEIELLRTEDTKNGVTLFVPSVKRTNQS